MLCQDKLLKHAEGLMFCPRRVALGREKKEGMKKKREKIEERKKKGQAGSTKTPSFTGTPAETERARESVAGGG